MMIDKTDYEQLMADASHIKIHSQAAGTQDGN
jgi:hypothetical protein